MSRPGSLLPLIFCLTISRVSQPESEGLKVFSPGGPGYRPPFTPRFYNSGGAGGVSISPPDWYDVYNSSIYGNRKTDVNCIAEIVRADMKLRSVLQGE